MIKEGAHDDIGAEKLRGLLKILPEVDELDVLKSFEGDKLRLGNAEKFLLQLIEVPKYAPPFLNNHEILCKLYFLTVTN